MKKFITFLVLILSLYVTAQDKEPEVSGLKLENIEYPFPVSEITLNIQGQSLIMAYMDLKPQKPNGKTVMLLHGKNFCGAYWEQTAKDLAK